MKKLFVVFVSVLIVAFDALSLDKIESSVGNNSECYCQSIVNISDLSSTSLVNVLGYEKLESSNFSVSGNGIGDDGSYPDTLRFQKNSCRVTGVDGACTVSYLQSL